MIINILQSNRIRANSERSEDAKLRIQNMDSRVADCNTQPGFFIYSINQSSLI